MQTRRDMLTRSASVAAALAGLGLLPQAALANWSQAALLWWRTEMFTAVPTG